jgi:hypothetical protein
VSVVQTLDGAIGKEACHLLNDRIHCIVKLKDETCELWNVLKMKRVHTYSVSADFNELKEKENGQYEWSPPWCSVDVQMGVSAFSSSSLFSDLK